LTFWTVGQNLDEPDQFHAKKSRANQPGFVVFEYQRIQDSMVLQELG